MIPSYWGTREDAGLEPYVGVVMSPAKDVILDFGTGIKRKMVAYDDTIFVDAGYLMESLNKHLNDIGVKFIKKKIHNISDINSKVIINCAGLGARDLTNDQNLVAVQGHLIMLKDLNPSDIDYMVLIYLKDAVTESGHKVKRSFYIFPMQLSASSKMI